MRVTQILRIATVVVLALVSACSMFGGGKSSSKKSDKKIDPPAELVKFDETLRVNKLWQGGVGGDKPVLRMGLGVGIDGERAFVAGFGGDVVAYGLNNGREIWRTHTKAPIAGGTGAGNGLVAVGTNKGDVIALNQADGKQRWRVKVAGEVLSAPAIAAKAVVVRTVDGRLRGLALDDGHELWRVEQQTPRLTLRGTASPVLVGSVAICGFDNGKVLAVNIGDGTVVWEAAVAPPRGRTELERLVDIDSAVRVVGDDIYVVGFQGRVAMLALDSGQVWWSRELSSYRGLAVDADTLYVSTAEGEVVALARRTGAELWRNKSFHNRSLSAPAVVGASVAVADFDGYVHWLDKTTGGMVARSRVGKRVSTAPLVTNNTLLVIDDDGRLSALQPVAAK